MGVLKIYNVHLYFQYDTAGGATATFRVGQPTSPYTIDVATDFARCYDNFVLLQLPSAEVVSTITGTVKSNCGMGLLHVNVGRENESVYTVNMANYFTNGNVRTVLLKVDTTSSFEPQANPPLA